MLSSLAYAIDHLDFVVVLVVEGSRRSFAHCKTGIFIFIDLWWCIKVTYLLHIRRLCLCASVSIICSTGAVFCL